MTGRRISEVIPGSLLTGGLVERHGNAMRSGRPLEYVLDYDADGVQGHFLNIVVPFGPYIAATFRDISESLRQQADLEAARHNAEKANLAKSRFLAAASHDLRQPLQAAVMFAYSLANHPESSRQASLIGSLQSSLSSVQEMLNLLLDISRLDSGTVTTTLAAFPLGSALDPIVAEASIAARESRVAIRYVPTRAVVHSDRLLLERIVRNLVTNALVHTAHGRVLIGCRRRAGTMLLQVWDTGVGIPPDQLDLIFEEFYQVPGQVSGQVSGRGVGDNSRRRKGLGLGLAIVQRLAAILNHPIRVHSVPGRGSLFEVALPSMPVIAPGASEAPTTEDVNHSGALVDALVVAIDDDWTILAGLRLLLGEEGYQVITASDPDTAAAALRGHGRPPDLVISDYHIHGTGSSSPCGVIARIRAEFGSDVPCIVLTGDTSPARFEEAQTGGFVLLNKPVPPSALLRVVSQVLNSRPRSLDRR
ncbi:MAG: hybrid sensor histidine kinase/response regulator [Alphaproteobacteria bacterium]|nr:hybrid sensor histidine kinase/response regulator [Alphaproteobacteria bacterium]